MITEEEIKEMAINTFAQTVECGAMCEECCSTLGNSPGGKVLCQMSDKPLEEDDYCPQQVMVIENFAHELYTKLFTAPSDLREKTIKEIRTLDWATRPVSGFEARVLAEKIHSLYIQAGWKSPEEVNEQVSLVCGNCISPEHIEQVKKEEREEILIWVQANALFIHPDNKMWQAKLKEWGVEAT